MPTPWPRQRLRWRARARPDRATSLNLETAVGRARVGGDAVRWQGATTLRAAARKEEQRRQRDAALLNRARSGVTHEVMARVGRKVCIHTVVPAGESGQLRFLGSLLRLRSGSGLSEAKGSEVCEKR